jgi:hypothetical protein
MVIIDRRQTLAPAQLVDNVFQFFHAETAPIAGTKILLELTGDPERFHTLRLSPQLAEFVKEFPGRALKNLTLALLQVFKSSNRRCIWNPNVKREAAAIYNLPIEHSDGIGRAYADGRKYPFGFLFYGRFYASVDGSCFCHCLSLNAKL